MYFGIPNVYHFNGSVTEKISETFTIYPKILTMNKLSEKVISNSSLTI